MGRCLTVRDLQPSCARRRLWSTSGSALGTSREAQALGRVLWSSKPNLILFQHGHFMGILPHSHSCRPAWRQEFSRGFTAQGQAQLHRCSPFPALRSSGGSICQTPAPATLSCPPAAVPSRTWPSQNSSRQMAQTGAELQLLPESQRGAGRARGW